MVKKIKKENIKTKNTNIYLYDFDGTIVKGDTGVKFFWWCQKQNKSLIKWVPYYAICTLLYCLKIVSHKWLKEQYFLFLPKDKKSADKMVIDFWKENIKQLNTKVVDMLKTDAKDKKGKVLIISGSPEFFIKPMADKLPAYALIATKMQKKNYKKIEGKNCNGKEKIQRFYKWISKENIKEFTVVKAVSDSLKDKPMYSLANNWYAVDGTGKITKGLPKKKTTFYFK